MSYVQDFARGTGWTYFWLGVMIGGIVFCMVVLVLFLLGRIDKDLSIGMTGRGYGGLMLLCICVAVYILYRQQGDWLVCLNGLTMLVYLVLCSVTDYYTQQVYDLIQLGVCVVAAGISLSRQLAPNQGAELIVFAVLQAVVFGQMYGEADVMCFLICALSMIEKGIFTWLCHMGISFLLLGIVQGFRHNISSDGNLKVPVAFFPYMAAAYVLVF